MGDQSGFVQEIQLTSEMFHARSSHHALRCIDLPGLAENFSTFGLRVPKIPWLLGEKHETGSDSCERAAVVKFFNNEYWLICVDGSEIVLRRVGSGSCAAGGAGAPARASGGAAASSSSGGIVGKKAILPGGIVSENVAKTNTVVLREHKAQVFAICSSTSPSTSVFWTGDSAGLLFRWDLEDILEDCMMTQKQGSHKKRSPKPTFCWDMKTPINDLVCHDKFPDEQVFGCGDDYSLFSVHFETDWDRGIRPAHGRMPDAEVAQRTRRETLVHPSDWAVAEGAGNIFCLDYFEGKFLIGTDTGCVAVLDEAKLRVQKKGAGENNSKGREEKALAVEEEEPAGGQNANGVHGTAVDLYCFAHEEVEEGDGGVQRVKWKKFKSGRTRGAVCNEWEVRV